MNEALMIAWMALVTTAVLYPRTEHIELGIANEYLIAAVISTLVAWRTRNVLITIVVGMAVLLGWRINRATVARTLARAVR